MKRVGPACKAWSEEDEDEQDSLQLLQHFCTRTVVTTKQNLGRSLEPGKDEHVCGKETHGLFCACQGPWNHDICSFDIDSIFLIAASMAGLAMHTINCCAEGHCQLFPLLSGSEASDYSCILKRLKQHLSVSLEAVSSRSVRLRRKTNHSRQGSEIQCKRP